MRMIGRLLVLVALVPAAARAETVTLRLVAADQNPPVPVSDRAGFRSSPYGGLIATEWISSARIGENSLFDPKLLPGLRGNVAKPTVDTDRLAGAADDLTDDIDRFVDEIETTGTAGRPQVAAGDVDPLYKTRQTPPGRRPIGPLQIRSSEAVVDVPAGARFLPGGIPAPGKGRTWDIPCYPVRIVSTAGPDSRRTVPFRPVIAWERIDLLKDCLFDYSPEMPFGDLSVPGSAFDSSVDKAIKLQQGTAEGGRTFQQLTLYMPAVDPAKPYTLNGLPFVVTTDGVRLPQADRTNDQGQSLAIDATDRWAVVLVQPRPQPPAAAPFAVPLLRDLGPGVTVEPGQPTMPVDRQGGSVQVKVRKAGEAEAILQVSLPAAATDGGFEKLALQVIAPAEGPAMLRSLAVRSSAATRDGELRLFVAQSSGPDVRSETRITDFDGRLLPWGREDAAGEKGVTVAFAPVKDEPGVFRATVADVPPGFYSLRLDLEPRTTLAVPLVVAGPATAGGVTLLTPGNREDYLRGERIEASAVVRALDRAVKGEAKLVLVQEGGERQVVGELPLDCPAGGMQSLAVSLDTSRLRLGHHQLVVESPAVVVCPMPFTLHEPQPETTFGIWASGPIGGAPVAFSDGKPIANVALGPSPSGLLGPALFQKLTRQRTMDPAFAAWLEADRLMPAVDATRRFDGHTAEMTAAMRLGLRYGPEWNWGIGGYEAHWNPKHTLPEDLDRVRRLCSLVTQRHREFGNFAGLYLNWYPMLFGYWEGNPESDGFQPRRNQRLQEEIKQVKGGWWYPQMALARAYDAWLAGCRSLAPGAGGVPLLPGAAASSDATDPQPGIYPGRPAYPSIIPVGWFDFRNHLKNLYYRSLPAVTTTAYADTPWTYFQTQMCVEMHPVGEGDKPIWYSGVSEPGYSMLSHALIGMARGADAIGLMGGDDASWRFVGEFLKRYGPLGRALEPSSELAMLVSFRQLVKGGGFGCQQGFTFGFYKNWMSRLWFAGRPPALLLEDQITLETLKRRKGLILVNQTEVLGEEQMQAIRDYVAAGGVVIKADACADAFPGTPLELEVLPPEKRPVQWDFSIYRQTHDVEFVKFMADYESIQPSLEKQLDRLLGRPWVTANSHRTQVACMGSGDARLVVAVNESHPLPPFTMGNATEAVSFWYNMVLPVDAALDFDKPYAVYDISNGGELHRPEKRDDGRFGMPFRFNEGAARVFLVLDAPIEAVRGEAAPADADGWVSLRADVVAGGRPIASPMPFEIEVVDDHDVVVQRLFRALGGDRRAAVRIPAGEGWRVRLVELASGMETEVRLPASRPPAALPTVVSPVHLSRPAEVAAFFDPAPQPPPRRGTPEEALRDPSVQVKMPGDPEPPTEKRFLILLDPVQLADPADGVAAAAESLRAALEKAGRRVEVRTVAAADVVAVPQRFTLNGHDRAVLEDLRAGRVVGCRESLGPVLSPLPEGARGHAPIDTTHPLSGYGEVGPRHLIYGEVILLGTRENNRFLDDVHATVGESLQATDGPGVARVQALRDPFVVCHDVLSIQARDAVGLERGVAAAIAILEGKPAAAGGAAPAKSAGEPVVAEGRKRRELEPLARNAFGARVNVAEVLADGGVVTHAAFASPNVIRLDSRGQVQGQETWSGRETAADGGAAYWMAPYSRRFNGMMIHADADKKPQWCMRLPTFEHWEGPKGKRFCPIPHSIDALVGGANRIARISGEGKIIWDYDDLATVSDPGSFRIGRNIAIREISSDGKHALIAMVGNDPYGMEAAGVYRPEMKLVRTADGRVLWSEPGDFDKRVCRFVDDERILIAGNDPRAPGQLRLKNLAGKVLSSSAMPYPAVEATAVGDTLVAVAETDQLILQFAPRAGAPARLVPLPAAFSQWVVQKPAADAQPRLLVATADDRVTAFDVTGDVVWQRHYPGGCLPVAGKDGLVAGTSSGRVRWLDAEGGVTREVDLNPYNVVKDLARYSRDVMASPENVPMRNPLAKPPRQINTRVGSAVRFSKNLVAGQPGVAAVTGGPFKGRAELNVPLEAGRTYVLSVVQRADQTGKLRVRVAQGGNEIYAAAVPLSSIEAERTVAWRSATAGPAVVTLESEGGDGFQGAAVSAVAVFGITYPSRNVLLQAKPPEVSKVQDLVLEDVLDDETLGLAIKPPDLSYLLPNNKEFNTAFLGPWTSKLRVDLPCDGQLRHADDTSWYRGRIIDKCSFATLTVKFASPVELAVLAVYEDPAAPERYTEGYGLFVRDRAGNYRQAGHVRGNQSPFNLFTFEPVLATELVYIWVGAPDGHARLAELEGYVREGTLLD